LKIRGDVVNGKKVFVVRGHSGIGLVVAIEAKTLGLRYGTLLGFAENALEAKFMKDKYNHRNRPRERRRCDLGLIRACSRQKK